MKCVIFEAPVVSKVSQQMNSQEKPSASHSGGRFGTNVAIVEIHIYWLTRVNKGRHNGGDLSSLCNWYTIWSTVWRRRRQWWDKWRDIMILPLPQFLSLVSEKHFFFSTVLKINEEADRKKKLPVMHYCNMSAERSLHCLCAVWVCLWAAGGGVSKVHWAQRLSSNYVEIFFA